MNATLVLALAFAGIIAVGTTAVAINDAIEGWLAGARRGEPGSGPGGHREAPGRMPQSPRVVAVATRRNTVRVQVRERRALAQHGGADAPGERQRLR